MVARSTKQKTIKQPSRRPRKIDIACGNNKMPGFKGIDVSKDSQADIVHDVFNTPWPIDSGVVSEAVCIHFVEHIPHADPRFNGNDGFFVFFDEVYRVLKKGGTIELIHPYVMSARAFWDPTHTRYIHEATWYYLNKEWRAAQNLEHYPTKTNFEIVTIDGIGISDDIIARSVEQQQFQRTHYWNVVPDLKVILKKL